MKSCTPKEREYENVSSSRYQRRGRDSNSPSGYYHGISEWSERYQGRGIKNIILLQMNTLNIKIFTYKYMYILCNIRVKLFLFTS